MRFTEPTVEELKLQAAKIGLPEREAEKFFCYYASKGWMVGKTKMKQWRIALTGWKLRWEEYRNANTRKSGGPDRNEHIVKREDGRAERILAAREAEKTDRYGMAPKVAGEVAPPGDRPS